ncbi:DUF6508 domain-containing protein [Methylobacterium durans]|uniref:Uncharacterized protein n=1 Tax=Methylobacterium durans TaxID=2202825 RepID=A0A2U8W6L8_9HYPH|nr:DUF6508 domain-containing protein [Methylobacterium durans]AWN41170.1 hypothetical protein DK389_12345 [Methylobacterium durans]
MNVDRPDERFAALESYIQVFEDPMYVFGTWIEEHDDDGHEVTRHFEPSATADAFVHTCYALGWILPDFPWAEWTQSDEWRSLRDDPTTLARATTRQIAQVLTVLVRLNRSSEGALAEAFNSGLLTMIVRRVREIRLEET